MTETNNTYDVEKNVLPEIISKLDDIVKRSKKIDADNMFGYVLGKEKQETRHKRVGGQKIAYTVDLVEVTLNGVIPKINNFEFIGKVVDEDGMTFADMVPFKQYPFEHKPDPSTCDHCKKKRNRKTGYILNNTETDEIIQVGKSCVKDFIGHDPSKVFFNFNLMGQIEELMEYGYWGQPSYIVKKVFMITKVLVDKYGFLSKGRAYELDRQDSTSNLVAEVLNPPKIVPAFVKEVNEILERKHDKLSKYASDVMEWLTTLEYGKNDYINNLAQFGGVEYFSNPRRLGLLCSALTAYDKNIKKLEATKAIAKNSDFVGEVKERLRDLKLIQKSCYEREGQWGTTLAYQLIDTDGNVFMYWGTVDFDVENGDTVTLDATVKKHDVYNGIKQTHITRCKVK